MTADPENLGPYRIVRRVGVGGMGVVYEAIHTGLDKRVALKVLPRELAANRLERFLREARTAAALHHTNIVPVFDVGQVDGVPYYAMQFIEGQPLGVSTVRSTVSAEPHVPELQTRTHEPQTNQTKTLAPTTATRDHSVASGGQERPYLGATTLPHRAALKYAVKLVLQAAEGLAYAHERGVVHRDIKPSNLLLDSEGVVWIADFGLAFRADDPSLTADGAILGTPRYMSPEQARAEKTDVRTDVYSLGVTLYELLTGTVAFPGDTPMSVIQKVLTHAPARPRALNRQIPRDLETVVLKAMAKRPEDRYATGREFAADLQRFLNGEPVKARRITVFGRAWRWAKRNPSVATLLAAVLVVFAAGAAISAYFARQAEDQERDAKRNAENARENADTAIELGKLGLAEKNKVLAAEKANRRLLYAARMNLAGVALREHNYGRVEELLRETFPKTNEEDLRGWEWHCLFRQLHPEARVIPLPTSATQLAAGPDRFLLFEVRDNKHFLLTIDSVTGKELFAHPAPSWYSPNAWRVEVSTNGRRLAGADKDETVVWDVDAGRELARIPGLPQYANGFPILSPTGDRLAKLTAWEKDAPRVMGGNDDPHAVAYEVWDVASGKRLTVLPPPDGFGNEDLIRYGRFSADSKTFGVLSSDRRCVVWDVASGKVKLDRRPATPVRGQAPLLDMIPGLAFDRTGTRAAVRSASHDAVEVYDLTKADPIPTILTGFAELVNAIEFSPDGAKLAVTDSAGAIIVFDLSGRQPPQRFRVAGELQNTIYFRPDGEHILVVEDKAIREWNLTNSPARRSPPMSNAAKVIRTSLAGFNKDGRWLMTTGPQPGPNGGDDDGVDLWDTRTLTVRRLLEETDDALLGNETPVWSRDGKRAAVIVGRSDPLLLAIPVPTTILGLFTALVAGATREPDYLLVLDAETGRVEHAFWLPIREMFQPEFSPCGRFIAVTSTSEVVVYDLSSSRCSVRIRAPREDGMTAGFSSQQRVAIVRQAEDLNTNELELRSLSTGEVFSRATVSGVTLGRPEFSPDGRWLALLVAPHVEGMLTRRLVVWDCVGDRLQLVADMKLSSSGRLLLHGFSPDGRWLAIQAGNRKVVLVEAGTWREASTLAGGLEECVAVQFTADGRRVMVFSANSAKQELRMWDTTTGQELLSIPCGEVFWPLQLLPPHFDSNRFTFVQIRSAGEVQLETLDGTPVPDAIARERLGIK